MDIRLIRPGEEAACNDFHNRLYGQQRTMSQWRWEFTENRYDRSQVPFALVIDDDRIVGSQAFIPIQMIDRDGIYWTAKSEATLVDPDYRGQRLFEKMYNLLFQYAEEHEFSYVWGFTPATKAFTRLDFTVPGVTGQLFQPFSSRSVTAMFGKLTDSRPSKPLDRVKASALRVGSKIAGIASAVRVGMTSRALPAGMEVRTMHEPDEQAGACCRRFIEKYGGTTIYRDSNYLRWRLFDNPYVKSIVRAIYLHDELQGWVAYTLGDDGLGYLVDIFVASDEPRYKPDRLVRTLLLEAVLGTRNMGATGIRGWQVNEHPFDRLVCREACRVGFYHIKRGQPVVIFNCPASRTRASYDQFDDWYVNRIYTEGMLS
ncbi:MAG: GNAT family N-acetyltransferase [candidate division Zixibacteria bacterium]